MKKIDDRGTARQANIFLRNDLDHYLSLCDKNRGDLESPNIENPKVSTSLKTDVSELYLRIMYAEQIVFCIAKSLKACTNTEKHPYRSILEATYLNDLNSYQLESKYSCSRSTIQRIRKKALLEFADRFFFQQVTKQVSPIIDLHKYLDE